VPARFSVLPFVCACFLRSRIYVRQHFTAVCLNFILLASSQQRKFREVRGAQPQRKRKSGLENICFDFLEAMILQSMHNARTSPYFRPPALG
jgi:hypothetical protein